MEKKEITLIDLVKIAVNWIWVLILGAVVCSVVAFFYSTKMVTPMYSASSKYVIQTKGQNAESDVLESQRTVAYAQLAVGTYIDIVDTRNFAEELAFYMNGGVKERRYTKEAVDSLVKYGILADGGIIENGILRIIINDLAESGVIDASSSEKSTKAVVRDLFNVNETDVSGMTSAEIDAHIEAALNYDSLFPRIIADKELFKKSIYSGDSKEKIEALKELGLGEGKGYKDVPYSAKNIERMLRFTSAEESTTFTLVVSNTDPDEAYTIARLCEIVIADYIENLYPGTGVVTTIDSAVKNPAPTNNNTVLLTMIGFMGGFVLAFVVVYIIELADNRIKNEEELAAKTGLSVVGIIPDAQFEKSGTSAYDKWL